MYFPINRIKYAKTEVYSGINKKELLVINGGTIPIPSMK